MLQRPLSASLPSARDVRHCHTAVTPACAAMPPAPFGRQSFLLIAEDVLSPGWFALSEPGCSPA